ncbi:hypothetical protein [Methylophaga thalassica]|uniref:hypothetical protein n=2 Tax=Methylophaga TaxID=40222 RepID=UPI002E7B8545|nr:hypothetical protein [Methylophaga thalassica]WVI86375.1 hypothetical protein VSX76_07095 [Methylophaga thalassica]
MIYFTIKSDRKFLEDYYESARLYLHMKNTEMCGGTVSEINAEIARVRGLREKLARGLPRAKRLASIFQIPVVAFDPVSKAQCHAFSTLINEDSAGLIEDDQKLDLLNETIGACLEVERSQFLKLVNPFYWVSLSISKILRLPFWVLETAGFKSESFEKSLAGSVVRLVELLLLLVFLIYVGFSGPELKEVIKELVDV